MQNRWWWLWNAVLIPLTLWTVINGTRGVADHGWFMSALGFVVASVMAYGVFALAGFLLLMLLVSMARSLLVLLRFLADLSL